MKRLSALMGATALVACGSAALADGHEGERGRDGQRQHYLLAGAHRSLNPYPVGRHKRRRKRLDGDRIPLARYDENRQHACRGWSTEIPDR